MQDSTQSILTSAKRFFSGTMLSRISGMLRDMAMAYAFGTQEAVAAFLVAFRLSHLLRRLFGEGALQSAFIPHFESIRSQDSQQAYRFFCSLSLWLSLGLILIILFSMGAVGSAWMFVGFSAGNAEIAFLSLLLMPSLLFICLFGLNASLLQCERNYFISGVAPVAFNVIWIIGVLSLRNESPSDAMPLLALWVIVACLCQWLMTVPQTIAILKKREVSLSSTLFSQFSLIKKFCKPLFLGIIGVAATQVNNALDAIFARYADQEGPAFLWYALRIQQLPLALFGIAIAGALLPPLTRALSNQDQEKYHSFLQFAFKRTIALMLPITVGLFVMGDTCVAFLYGRGDFDAHSIIGTSSCLWGYSLGLIPMALVLIIAPAFYAKKDTLTPALISLTAVLLNIALNALFIFTFHLGAVSVAIATSISAWVNLIFLLFFLPERKEIFSRGVIREGLKMVAACFMASLTVMMVESGSGFIPFQIMQGGAIQFAQGFQELLMKLSLQGIVFCASLFIFGWLFRSEELLSFISYRRKYSIGKG